MTATAKALGAMLAAACAIAAPAVHAQPTHEERLDGTQRLCIYRAGPGLLTGMERTVVHETGMAENCPTTPPLDVSDQAPPPTAPLLSEETRGEVRTCVYGVAANRWGYEIAAERACPPAVGMLTQRRSGFDAR